MGAHEIKVIGLVLFWFGLSSFEGISTKKISTNLIVALCILHQYGLAQLVLDLSSSTRYE